MEPENGTKTNRRWTCWLETHAFLGEPAVTPPKFNSSPLNSYLPNRKVVFQPPFFRGYVKLRRCKLRQGIHPPLSWWPCSGLCLRLRPTPDALQRSVMGAQPVGQEALDRRHRDSGMVLGGLFFFCWGLFWGGLGVVLFLVLVMCTNKNSGIYKCNVNCVMMCSFYVTVWVFCLCML